VELLSLVISTYSQVVLDPSGSRGELGRLIPVMADTDEFLDQVYCCNLRGS